jgi:hypothetical protein
MNVDEQAALMVGVVFQRKALVTPRSGLYQDLSPEVRAFADGIVCEKGEAPVVISMKDADNWCMLTNRRLIWSREGNSHNLPYRKIGAVEVDLKEWTSAPYLDWPDPPASRLEIDRVIISTPDGSRFKVPVESPGALSGVLSALGWAIRHAAKRSTG